MLRLCHSTRYALVFSKHLHQCRSASQQLYLLKSEKRSRNAVAILQFESNLSLICRRKTTGNEKPNRWDEAQRQSNQLASQMINSYENWLKKYPKFYRIHRIIFDGSKHCWRDLKSFYLITKDLRRGRSIAELNQEQLEVLIQTPNDLIKLLIIVTLSPLPFTFYFIFVAIIFLPRLILTRHFWTPEQCSSFWLVIMKRRREIYYMPIANHVSASHNITAPLTYNNLKSLASSTKTLGEIGDTPFLHQCRICRVHGILPVFNYSKRLLRRATAIHYHDLILKNSGLVDNMTILQLQQNMFMRQLDYEGKTERQMRQILNDWVDFNSNPMPFALRLHAPVLLQTSSSN